MIKEVVRWIGEYIEKKEVKWDTLIALE